MAELVNQRIEDMINELEQMKRTNLYDDEEIREIARKRKEFEYKVQRRVKSKEDFVNYIAYELALVEDITLRRKQSKLTEKKKDIEYAIVKRLNKLFKQFIYRFQNDIEVYFQYIKFCQNVGFEYAISGIIGQMLQIYGDKPKMWLMASKWETEDQNNYENARTFLLKGLHRHPESEILYLELFKVEIVLAYRAKTDEEKEKQIKRADVVWRNGLKNINEITYLFKLYDLSQQYNVAATISEAIKQEIWSRNNEHEVWSFIAVKELQGDHWDEIEEFIFDDNKFPNTLKYFIGIYEEALHKFPIEKLCTKYIHELLRIDENVCSNEVKVKAMKHAWMSGHEHELLSNDMYEFGIEMLKLENETTQAEMIEILDGAVRKNPSSKALWEEKMLIVKPDEMQMLSVLQNGSKVLKSDDTLHLWNTLLENVSCSATLKSLHSKLQNCESAVLLAVKPKLLLKLYEHCGIKSARDMYDEFIRMPPVQSELHNIMIDIEKKQPTLNTKFIRKCYESFVQHHGADDINVWTNYIKFETENGNAQTAPAIYRRAVAGLKKELVDEFIKVQTLSKLN